MSLMREAQNPRSEALATLPFPFVLVAGLTVPVIEYLTQFHINAPWLLADAPLLAGLASAITYRSVVRNNRTLMELEGSIKKIDEKAAPE